MLYLALDDTDSLKGMCTTFLATEMIREFSDLDIIGYPRLVRLNPNVPWKTRGNGALCIRLGRGTGGKFKIGELAGQDVYGWRGCDGNPPPEDVLPRAITMLEKWAELDDELTNPAVAVLEGKPPQSFYWRAVRDVVSIIEAKRAATEAGAWKAYKNGRGIVGCVASSAWRPRDRTYEILAYRQRQRWRTKRDINVRSVIAMDRKFPATFNNYDYLNGKVAIAPASPCPILFGIRSERPDGLFGAMNAVRGEKPERWFIFETNQGTDEHLVRPKAMPRSHTSVILKGRIGGMPMVLVGGHVIFRLDFRHGSIECAAYEPSKQFRKVARALLPGDRVLVCGSVRDKPRTLNVEKLQVLELIPAMSKQGNPRCPTCGKRMKSMGRMSGFRCVKCGEKAPLDAAEWKRVERSIELGWYEPPVSARRHIAKPLKRMGFESNAYPA